MIGMMFASDTNLQSEQTSRLNVLIGHAKAGTVTIGDMHEAAAHYRIFSARARDLGLESKVDAYIRDTHNTAKLVNACMNQHVKGISQTDCQNLITMTRSVGSHQMMLDIASVTYAAADWGNFIPTGYQRGAHLVPVLLPNCRGVGQAVAASAFISSVFALIPGGEPAGLVGGAFTLFLALIAAGVC
jgi:hypothetical protein